MARAISTHFLIILSMEHCASAQEENHFIYKGFHDQANLQLDGNAVIHPSGLLQLTNTSKQVAGHVFYRFPLKFNSSSSELRKDLSFSTNFVFAIVPEFLNTTSGHGIAFVISPSMDFSGAVASQYLGLFNKSNDGISSNHVLAVEFDTIKSPEFRDIDDDHVGIDINSLISNVSTPVTYYSEGKNVSLKLTNGHPIQVWIEYDEAESLLNVSIAPTSIPKPSLPLLSTPIDLSLILLDYMYVGFSSATGSIASNHYVLGWSFNKSGQAAQSLDISELPPLPRQTKSGKGLGLGVKVTILIIAVAVLAMIVCMVLYLKRRQVKRRQEKRRQEKRRQEELKEPPNPLEEEYDHGPQIFDYNVLSEATDEFNETEIIGSGGFGNVYKGVLPPPSNKQIAVKRISTSSEHGLKQFVSEIVTMGRARHKNLVRLLGYCKYEKELLLVYDYMSNGSVDQFLFTIKKPTLTWGQRFQILKDVASALLYLHEGCEQVILHRDVKAGNVMLDADMNGRIGDFGLARLYDHGAIPKTTIVVGTVGYLAPELFTTGQATTSSDVFAFGAFMLEVACGRRPIVPHAEEIGLVNWVLKSQKKGDIRKPCDPKLMGRDYVVEEMERVLKLGLLCCHSNPADRPSIMEVTHWLDPKVQEIHNNNAGIDMASTSNEITADPVQEIPSDNNNAGIDMVSTSNEITADPVQEIPSDNNNAGIDMVSTSNEIRADPIMRIRSSFDNAFNHSWSTITTDSILCYGR